MRSTSWRIIALLPLLAAAGCGLLEPRLPEAEPGISPDWPLPPETAAEVAGDETAAMADTPAEVGWRDFFDDAELEPLIAVALENNRDLRVAVLNVDRARALYRIQRADRFPSLDAGATLARNGGDGNLQPPERYSADLGVTAYELDIFGRVHNLSRAQHEAYLSQVEARRSVQLALVAEVANAWLTLEADRELQRIAEAALANRRKELELTQKRFELGAASQLEVSQSTIELETARTDVWRYAGQVARDINALSVLTGAPVDAESSGGDFDLDVTGPGALPPGLPSNTLLKRPDVMQAEHLLRAANARIGAARAAFFPFITLTGSVGSASDDLADLFSGGTDAWSFVPQVSVPIFQAGRLRGNLDASRAERDIALAEYERTIQVAFREVADALALNRTLAEQRRSREALLAAAQRADELSRRRYEAGTDSFLVLLDAQRTLYDARQALVTTIREQQANRIELYKALGGGWSES